VQVVITVNGPGEVAGWLTPFVTEIKARWPALRVFVCLLPCVFSSGREDQVIRDLGLVEGVTRVAQTWAFVLGGRLPEGMTRDPQTLVVHLGGETLLTRAISWRLGAPVYAYRELYHRTDSRFQKVFYTGITHRPDDPAMMIGEMMVDAADLRRKGALARKGAGKTVALFPGSRGFMVGPLLPWYAGIIDRIAPAHPGVDWVVARSDFVTDDFLRALPAPPDPCPWPLSRLTVGAGENGLLLVTEGGTRLQVLPGREAILRADLALTVPGTNTGDLAALGVPMVVAFPTYMPDVIPMPGLLGFLAKLPRLGPWMRQRALQGFLDAHPWLALPNRRAGRALVPEFRGQGFEGDLAAALDGLISSPSADLPHQLRAAMGRPGAAARLADVVGEYFGLGGAAADVTGGGGSPN